MEDLKKKFGLPIAVVVIVCAVALMALSFKSSQVTPTAENLPDYSKMSAEEIAAQKQSSRDAEKANAR